MQPSSTGAESTQEASKTVEVLVIEDNPGDVWMIRHALADVRQPISLRVATDAHEAGQMLIDRRPDLVILDLSVPRHSGLGVLEQSRLHCVPVVVFSSAMVPAQWQQLSALGVKDFVQKPNEYDEYRKLLSRIIETWASPDVKAASAS